MRTKQRRHVIGIMLTSLAVSLTSIHSACSSVSGLVATPEVQLTGLSLLDGSGELQRFRVSFEVSNPNAVAVPFEELQFSVRLGGEGVLIGQSTQAVTLPANGSETIRVEVESDIVSSMSRLLAVAQGPNDELAYELNGRLGLGGRPPRLLPFSYRGQVPLSATMGTR